MKLKTLLASMMVFLPAAAHAEVSVKDAWLRETPGQSKVSAAYASIENTGAADTLTGITMSVPGMAEVHRSMQQDGIMKMDAVPRLEVPAKGKVELKPGSFHVMVMNLQQPLKVGETVNITFTFEHAGKVTVPAKVAPLGATTAP